MSDPAGAAGAAGVETKPENPSGNEPITIRVRDQVCYMNVFKSIYHRNDNLKHFFQWQWEMRARIFHGIVS